MKNVSSSQNLESNIPLEENSTKHNKKLLIPGLLLLLLSIVPLIFLFNKSSKNIEQSRNTTVLKNTPTPIPPSALTFEQLTNDKVEGNMKVFTDDVLNISFRYPRKYTAASLKADEKDKNANVFFLLDSNSKAKDYITYAINCEIDNRNSPTGVCRESILGDLEIGISELKENDRELMLADKECTKKIISTTKTEFICPTQLSIDPNSKGTKYDLILEAKKPLRISLSTAKSQELTELVNTIVNTVEIMDLDVKESKHINNPSGTLSFFFRGDKNAFNDSSFGQSSDPFQLCFNGDTDYAIPSSKYKSHDLQKLITPIIKNNKTQEEYVLTQLGEINAPNGCARVTRWVDNNHLERNISGEDINSYDENDIIIVTK